MSSGGGINTFLPYEDFEAPARTLESRRLGKQRIEARQILRVLRGQSAGWRHHPAVLIWQGCEHALAGSARRSRRLPGPAPGEGPGALRLPG